MWREIPMGRSVQDTYWRLWVLFKRNIGGHEFEQDSGEWCNHERSPQSMCLEKIGSKTAQSTGLGCASEHDAKKLQEGVTAQTRLATKVFHWEELIQPGKCDGGVRPAVTFGSWSAERAKYIKQVRSNVADNFNRDADYFKKGHFWFNKKGNGDWTVYINEDTLW